MGRVSRFLAVSIGDKFRLVLAVPLLLGVRVGLFVVPFATFRAALVTVASVVGRLVPGSPSPYRVAWAVDRADRTVPGHRTCLMRSLTSETIHVLYGHNVVHRIGVATDGDGDASDGGADSDGDGDGEDEGDGDENDNGRHDGDGDPNDPNGPARPASSSGYASASPASPASSASPASPASPAGVDGFEAHSWIEYDGEVILGYLEDLSRFEPLPPLNETERP